MAPERAEEFDVVALREPIGEWPAGTEGTVLETYEDGALVEVGKETVQRIDLGMLVEAPYDSLRVVGRRQVSASDRVIADRRAEDLKYRRLHRD